MESELGLKKAKGTVAQGPPGRESGGQREADQLLWHECWPSCISRTCWGCGCIGDPKVRSGIGERERRRGGEEEEGEGERGDRRCGLFLVVGGPQQ